MQDFSRLSNSELIQHCVQRLEQMARLPFGRKLLIGAYLYLEGLYSYKQNRRIGRSSKAA